MRMRGRLDWRRRTPALRPQQEQWGERNAERYLGSCPFAQPRPEATAAWLEDILGGEIVRGPGWIESSSAAPRFIAPVTDGDGVNSAPVTPYQGLDHFGLTVKDIDAVAAEIKAKGVEFTKPPTTIRPGVRICFIRGPQASRSSCWSATRNIPDGSSHCATSGLSSPAIGSARRAAPMAGSAPIQAPAGNRVFERPRTTVAASRYSAFAEHDGQRSWRALVNRREMLRHATGHEAADAQSLIAS